MQKVNQEELAMAIVLLQTLKALTLEGLKDAKTAGEEFDEELMNDANDIISFIDRFTEKYGKAEQ